MPIDDAKVLNLIVCADGTWNDEEVVGAPTNVARMHRAVKAHGVDADDQLVYYHNGVGTRLGQRLSGGVFGDGINETIKASYRFIVEHYRPGARLWLFGFSRGAYTVRSLAGLIRNSGIVDGDDLVGGAFDLYRSRAPEDHPRRSAEFRAKYSSRTRDAYVHDPELAGSPEIWFIGVWDTVGSLGVPIPPSWRPMLRLFGLDWSFHDTTLSRTIVHAYHALAIHERRTDFAPTLWEKQPGAPAGQTLAQRWFTGAHSDVGGGYGGTGLSDLAFSWIAKRAIDCGLALRENAFTPGPWHSPDPLGRCHNSSAGVFGALDMFRFHGNGVARTYGESPEFCAELAPEVWQRFELKGTRGHWPPTFLQALQKRALKAGADARGLPGPGETPTSPAE